MQVNSKHILIAIWSLKNIYLEKQLLHLDARLYTSKQLFMHYLKIAWLFIVYTPPPPWVMGGGGVSQFSKCVYMRDLCIVCIGVSTHLQKHHLLFLAKRPSILVFCDPPSLKSQIFQWTPKILKFFILNTILSFKSN